MASKIEPIVRECQRQVENCLYTSTALFEVIRWQECLRFWGSALPLILGSFATWNVLTAANDPRVKVITALCAFLAGLIPAIYSALKIDESLDHCRAVASEFKNIQDRFRQAAQIVAPKGLAELEQEFKAVMNRMDEARKHGIMVPNWAFRRAQMKVKSGDYTFDVDIAALENDAANSDAKVSHSTQTAVSREAPS